MKSIEVLAKQAYTAILGSIGAGASGSPASNSLSQENAAPIGPATSVRWDSSAFVSRTGRVLILAQLNLTKTGGTFAAGDNVSYQLVRDSGGGEVALGPNLIDGGHTAGVEVTANGSFAWIDTPTPGASHTYGIKASIAGGHTGGVQIGGAVVAVIDL